MKSMFDDATMKWFDEHPNSQTSIMECKRCGLSYKPSLGHKCKLLQTNNMNIHKKRFFEVLADDSYGLIPAPLDADEAIQVLVQYLLGEDWYISLSMSQEQANTEIVAAILNKYSKEYRKDLKKIKNNKSPD